MLYSFFFIVVGVLVFFMVFGIASGEDAYWAISILLLVMHCIVFLVVPVKTETIYPKNISVEKTETRVIVIADGVEETFKDIEIYKKIEKLKKVSFVEKKNVYGMLIDREINLTFVGELDTVVK